MDDEQAQIRSVIAALEGETRASASQAERLRVAAAAARDAAVDALRRAGAARERASLATATSNTAAARPKVTQG